MSPSRVVIEKSEPLGGRGLDELYQQVLRIGGPLEAELSLAGGPTTTGTPGHRQAPVRGKGNDPGRRDPRGRQVKILWLRGTDSNRRPSGYEPDELPLLHPARGVYTGS